MLTGNPDRLDERDLRLLLADNDYAYWKRVWQQEGDDRWFCMSQVPNKGTYIKHTGGMTYTISYATTQSLAILRAQAKAIIPRKIEPTVPQQKKVAFWVKLKQRLCDMLCGTG